MKNFNYDIENRYSFSLFAEIQILVPQAPDAFPKGLIVRFQGFETKLKRVFYLFSNRLIIVVLSLLLVTVVSGCSFEVVDNANSVDTDTSENVETNGSNNTEDDQDEDAETNTSEEAEDVVADDDGGSEKSPFDQTGEDIELSSLIPSDVPLPDDSEVTAYGDDEEQGSINISTSMALADLEALYDDYFNGHPQSDEVEKEFYEEEDHDLLSYTIDNDDHLFLIMVTDYGDLVTVHTRYLIY